MSASFQRDRIEIVLVSPRNPLNIGAVARAMANFGFARLTVVAPYEPHWREARSAVGAGEILQGARCAQYLAEAVADCTFVAGTGSLARRTPEQAVVALPGLVPRVARELARGGRAALVFGPEKRGLTRDDLALCHVLAVIPTDPHQPSMNLGQAAAVCLYELAKGFSEDAAEPRGPGAAPVSEAREPAAGAPAPAGHSTGAELPATSAQLALLAGVVEQVIESAHYSPSAMRDANRHDLRLLLRRMALTERDARRSLGLFRKIFRRLPH